MARDLSRSLRWKGRAVAAGLATSLVGVVGLTGAAPALASSHREAPLISQDPVADNTDVYLFRDAANPAMVNFVADYIGLEDPSGGPNFARFGDDVLYELHVDNTGDAVDDITYQFRFKTTVANPNTFLYNTGQVSTPNDPDLNVKQTYSVRRVTSTSSTVIATDVETSPANVGPRTTPSYDQSFMTSFVSSLAAPVPTGKVFAGVADDPFFVDLGSVFDLLGLRPLNQAHAIQEPTAQGVDGLSQKNVHSIVMQLPLSEVLSPTAPASCSTSATTVTDPGCVIGVYASSSRSRVKVLSTGGGQPRNLGRFVQVSRLGLPLVNEVLIPLGKKDLFNATSPKDDVANFGANILDPEPAKLADALYPSLNTPPPGGSGRSDIVAILTGAAQQVTGLTPADLLRLNVSVPPTAPANESRYGVLGADSQLGTSDDDYAGFPNGRRLKDDVVDTELRLLTGGTNLSPTPSSNASPNTILTDGVDASAVPPLPVFPYVGLPTSGYNKTP